MRAKPAAVPPRGGAATPLSRPPRTPFGGRERGGSWDRIPHLSAAHPSRCAQPRQPGGFPKRTSPGCGRPGTVLRLRAGFSLTAFPCAQAAFKKAAPRTHVAALPGVLVIRPHPADSRIGRAGGSPRRVFGDCRSSPLRRAPRRAAFGTGKSASLPGRFRPGSRPALCATLL